jgi:hypothetical protein
LVAATLRCDLCDLISVSQLFISERSGPARQSGESL